VADEAARLAGGERGPGGGGRREVERLLGLGGAAGPVGGVAALAAGEIGGIKGGEAGGDAGGLVLLAAAVDATPAGEDTAAGERERDGGGEQLIPVIPVVPVIPAI